MKQCSECQKEGVGPKALTEFCKNRTQADGLQGKCKKHTREYNRAWAKRFPEKNRAKTKRFRIVNPNEYRRIANRTYLKNTYGLSEKDYEDILVKQEHKCKICSLDLISQLNGERPFAGHAPNNIARVDHCHKTGRIRGMLCFSCNVGLGKFQDDEQLILKAARYLRESVTE